MSPLLDERPEAGNKYDDDTSSWYKGSGSDDPHGDLMNTNFDDLDALPTAGDDDLPEGHPSKKKKPAAQAQDGDSLRQAESNVRPSERPTASPLAGEGDIVGRGYKGGGGGGIVGFARKRNSKIAGGSIIATIITFVGLGFGTGSLYLQDLTSGLRSKKNPMAGPIQRRLERRRTKSALTAIKSGSAAINQAKFAGKLEAAGFEVKYAKNGVIDSIGKDGKVFKLNKLEAATIQQQGEAIFANGNKVGQAFIDGFDNIAAERAATTIGKRTRSAVIKDRLGISYFTDWIAKRKKLRPSELANAPPENQFADAIRNASDTEAKVEIAAQQADADLLKEQGIDEDNPLKPGEGIDKAVDENTAAKAEAYAKEARTNGGKGIAMDATEKAIIDSADEITEDIAKAGAKNIGESTAHSLMKTVITKITEKLGAELVGKIGKALARGAGGLDLSQIPRIGCRVKGTLNFLANVRNVMLAQELASFAVRYFTISDNQRAGLIQGESVKLMSIYLSGATSAGGMQRLRGNPAAAIGSSELSLASVTRADNGIFGGIRRFINEVPGVNNPKVCSLSNNFLVSVGATIVGGILGIASGGTSVAASIGISVGLTTVEEVTFAVAEPMILKNISKQVITGLESGPQAGALLASGASALAGMSGSANVGLPTTKLLAATLRQEAMEDYKREVASMSFYDRYFNLKDGKSLLSSIAFRAPRNTGELTSGIAKVTRGGIASIGGMNNLQSLTSPLFASKSAYAAGVGSGCTDEWLEEKNIETDAYCNILTATIVDTDVENARTVLLNNGLIDGNGLPTDKAPPGSGLSFQKWVQNCASGRAGLMYNPDIQKDGSNNPQDSTCIETGPTLAGDVMEKFEDPLPVDGRSWFAKKMFPRVNAQNSTLRVPGLYERYATWYGYVVDEENLSEDINDQLVPLEESGSTGGVTAPGGQGTPLNLQTGPDTSNIPCAAGTDNGVVDGYAGGVKSVIRICRVQGFVVNSQVSKQFDDMSTAAAAAGISFVAPGFSGSFRSMDQQIATYLRWCKADGITPSPPPYPKLPAGSTTKCPGGGAPGFSNHQMGFAMDLGCDGVGIQKSYAEASKNRCFQWLQANAGKYGFFELGKGKPESRSGPGYEGWHWSVNGN